MECPICLENTSQFSGSLYYYTPCVGCNLVITMKFMYFFPSRKFKNNFIGISEKTNRESKLKILAAAKKREIEKRNELHMSFCCCFVFFFHLSNIY